MKYLFILTPFMAFSALAETNREILDRLVLNETHGKIVKVFDQPTMETVISLEYSLDEMRLNPKDVLYFYLPDRLSTTALSQLGFAHRQIGQDPGLDYNPGLTSALVYTSDFPGDELRYWGGSASGKLGSKFAEYRKAPELDTLFEWPKIGHYSIKAKTKKDRVIGSIHANVVRIQNTGTDYVYFSKLYIETIPPVAKTYEESVFTPNSTFGDPVTMTGRTYGGGQILRGKFPHSLRLSTDGHRTYPVLPAHMAVVKNQLFINLQVGAKFSSVDMMVGDTYPDGDTVRNKDGGYGSLGTASIKMEIQNQISGEVREILHHKNVGPQGVISASDLSDSLVIKDGDRLVITNEYKKSTAYIMALRLGYN